TWPRHIAATSTRPVSGAMEFSFQSSSGSCTLTNRFAGLQSCAVYCGPPRRQIMKLLLIALGLLATTAVVYPSSIFCCVYPRETKRAVFFAAIDRFPRPPHISFLFTLPPLSNGFHERKTKECQNR